MSSRWLGTRRPHEQRSLAQVASLVAGVWWLANGIGAFLVDSNFGTGHVHGGGDLLGVAITANGWHGLFHLLSGLIGIVLARRSRAALGYALVAGALYIGIGVWGLLAGGDSIGAIAVDRSGDLVHALEGAFLFAAGIVTLQVRGRSTDRLPAASSW